MTQANHSDSTDPLAHSHLNVTITDLVATCEMTHQFRNLGDEAIEAVFTFPIPLDAAFLGMDATIGDEHIHAEIGSAQQATQDYDDAIADGDSGALLQMPQPGLVTMTLGNLLPDEQATIRLCFATQLGMAGQVARFGLPLVQRPRYGHWQLHEVDIPENDFAAQHPLSATIKVRGILARAAIHSHMASTRFQRDGGMTVVSLDSAMLDRDFVLNFELPSAVRCNGHMVDDADCRIGVVTMVAPESSEPSPPLDVCLMLDCSGSMSGDAISQSRDALRAVITALKNNDRIQVLRFGSQTQALLRRPLSANLRVRNSLAELVSTIVADLGGTEMGGALQQAIAQLSQRRQAKRSSAIILVTDGAVQPQELEAATTSAQTNDIRLFVVAVGSSAGVEVLEPVSTATGGKLERAVPTESVDACVMRHIKRARQRSAWPVTVKWPGELLDSMAEQVVYPGDAITLYARMDRSISSTDARVDIPALAWSSHVILQPTPEQTTWRAMYGAARYQTVSDDQRESVALRYQLLTRETAAVLVKARAEDEKGSVLPRIERVRHMVPNGMIVEARLVMARAASDALWDIGINYDKPSPEYAVDASDEAAVSAERLMKEYGMPELRIAEILIALSDAVLQRLRIDTALRWTIQEAIDQLPVGWQSDAARLCQNLELSGRSGAIRLLVLFMDEPSLCKKIQAKDNDSRRLASLLDDDAHSAAAVPLPDWIIDALTTDVQDRSISAPD